MNEFTLTRESVMERLSWIVIWESMRFQKSSSALRERHEVGACFPIDGPDMANQPLGAEVIKVAVPQVGSAVAMVPEIVDRDDSECPHGCERAHLGATQVVLLFADRDGFAIGAAWQVEALRKGVAWIDNVEGARIPLQAAGAASGWPVSGVVPTGIFERHSHRGFVSK